MTFPHHVDIVVPEGGLGKQLDQMHGWCTRRFERGSWAQFGLMEKLGQGRVARTIARFYFDQGAAAEEFAKRWVEQQDG